MVQTSTEHFPVCMSSISSAQSHYFGGINTNSWQSRSSPLNEEPRLSQTLLSLANYQTCKHLQKFGCEDLLRPPEFIQSCDLTGALVEHLSDVYADVGVNLSSGLGDLCLFSSTKIKADGRDQEQPWAHQRAAEHPESPGCSRRRSSWVALHHTDVCRC